jgi:hypothetical protein
VIGPFLSDKAAHLKSNVRPLQQKQEPVYVVPGSDAEGHVVRRFPHKSVRRVGGSLHPQSIQGFLDGLPLLFQREQSEGLDATYHFTFTGDEPREATVVIRQRAVQVQEGYAGDADLHLTADSRTWLGFLAKERSLVWALLTRKIRFRGSPRLLTAFGRCFPS